MTEDQAERLEFVEMIVKKLTFLLPKEEREQLENDLYDRSMENYHRKMGEDF